MNTHVRLHQFYSSTLVRILRLLVLILLLSFVFYSLNRSELPKYPLFFVSVFVMWEVFFHFSLSKLSKGIPVSDNKQNDPLLSFSHQTIDLWYSAQTTHEIVSELHHSPGVGFMLERIGSIAEKVPTVDVPKEELAKRAFSLASQLAGTYVTTMDVFASYLLLSEAETKLLFQHELKEANLLDILQWAKMYDTHEEGEQHHSWYKGDGFGEGMVYGWTPETAKYTTPYYVSSPFSQSDLFGKQTEYETLVRALSQSENRNVVLVGEAGIGKETMVETLAFESQRGLLSGQLNHKRVITLMIGPLLAGTGDRSELEVRLQAVIGEISHAGNIILFIPELQEILGESSYNVNLSGALLPYLKDGNLPIIATITPENYKSYLQKNGLHEVFTTITLTEPDEAIIKQILCKTIITLETKSDAIVTYTGLTSALSLSKRYLPDDILPGSSVKLIKDAMQAAPTQAQSPSRLVTKEVIEQLVEGKVHAPVSQPKQDEKKLLLHFEQELHNRVIGQDQAITVISEAIRRLRTGVTKHERPVSFLFLGPTGVGKTETAKALATLYYGGEGKMIRLDMSEYVDSGSVARLLGSQTSEHERGELTEKIHDDPYTLVLLDEFEKAHPSILDLFLQVLSDGRLTDSRGRTVTFNEAMIIATSNAGSEYIREEFKKGIADEKLFQQGLIEQIESHHIFKPELLNRFDAIVTFKSLSNEQLQQVVALQLQEVVAQMAEKDILVTFDDEVLEQIVRMGSDEQFGARPLKRYIQDTIDGLLAKLTLEEKLERGSTIRFIVGPDKKITTTL